MANEIFPYISKLRGLLYSPEHVILDSGKHSDGKLNPENLNGRHSRTLRRNILKELGSCCTQHGVDTLIVTTDDDLFLFDRLHPLKIAHVLRSTPTERGMSINHPAAGELIRRASGVAVFQTIVSDGQSALAAVRAIWEHNSTVPIGLASVWWRETDLSSAAAIVFDPATSFSIVNEPIESWPTEECPSCLHM